ncbi:MAG: hypothetical protein KA100_00795 [Rickettsiales bacterium]|nr:hypothetical protein [Rickettsiales bacterium]
MPQLDTTQYSSQLFWFLLCFAVLYIFASRIILPRIRNILSERKNVIDADLSSAANLDDKLYALQNKTDALRKDASQKYQTKLEEVAKDAASKREKMLSELKEKIEQITEKSRSELKDFIAKSRAESDVAIKNLSQKIKEKLFN